MTTLLTGNRFYVAMGLILLGFVTLGFGSAAVVRGQSPLELPMLYHIHGASYLLWFCLFIFQAALIGKAHRDLHMTLGKISPVLIAALVVTGWLMAKGSFERGVSPIPDISIQQFMSFPFFDLVGLIVFYSLALWRRSDADFHKRAMLLSLVAIMDPATARIGLAAGFPPFPVLASIAFVGAVMWHDRRMLKRIHVITWFGFVWIFLRLGFVFGFASTSLWTGIAERLFGTG